MQNQNGINVIIFSLLNSNDPNSKKCSTYLEIPIFKDGPNLENESKVQRGVFDHKLLGLRPKYKLTPSANIIVQYSYYMSN